MARESTAGLRKDAFIPGQDMAGGGGMPPGDPAAAGGGGMPPGDPAAAGGGAPPGGGGGGGGQDILGMIMQKLTALEQGQAGGGANGSGAAIKPKIDVNVELMQIKNMLAKICDHLQIPIPAQDMVATPDKLLAMSQGQSPASGAAGAGGGAGGGAIGGIPPMQPMQGAGVPGAEKSSAMRPARSNGSAFDTAGIGDVYNRATAIARIRKTHAA